MLADPFNFPALVKLIEIRMLYIINNLVDPITVQFDFLFTAFFIYRDDHAKVIWIASEKIHERFSLQRGKINQIGGYEQRVYTLELSYAASQNKELDQGTYEQSLDHSIKITIKTLSSGQPLLILLFTV